jgi:hypothetical protein
MGQDNKKDNKNPHIYPSISRIFLITFVHLCEKNGDQDTYHVTISKMDEVEIFNELDTILESIHANFIVRNVQRHILISTAVKTLTLENVYERFFFIRNEK